MLSLTRLALDTLQDQGAATGLRTVACSALLHAFEAGIATPPGAQMAVWQFLLGSDASAVILHRHTLEHPGVARDAIRVLLDRDTGDGERDLALAVLRGSNVEHINPEDLVTIVDRVLDEGRARQVGHLIEKVHEQRGLPAEFLAAMRERLAGSEVSAVRAAAVEVAGLLARLDETFVLRMFRDESPVVRAAVADLLDRADELDRNRALTLVRHQLAIEQHRTVIAACHHALGSLVRSTRRVRQWDAPDESTQGGAG